MTSAQLVTLAGLGERLTATAQDPPQHHVRVAIDTRLRALLKHEPGTRDGVDPEDLHQMRVSVRRLRAVLRAARELLDRQWTDGLRTELGWLGGALGPVRDLDVLLQRLQAQAEQLGEPDGSAAQHLLAALHTERERAREVLCDALDSRRYQALLRRLTEAAAEPLPQPETGGKPPQLRSLVAKEFRRLRKAVRAAGDEPADATLHELRILGKRLRYTTELLRPALGAQVHQLLAATEAMQDVLGDHQDACVAQLRVRELLGGLGAAAPLSVAFAAGRLVEREEVRRIDTRAGWPPAWQAVSDAAQRAGLSSR